MLKNDLLNWDRTYVWHAFTQTAEYEPFVIERADGCELIDIDGRRYIDGVSSMWCNIHGHRHPTIDAAIREQLDKVAHVTNLGTSNPITIKLAKRLADIAPRGLKHVFFSGDGSSALEVAIKMAFQYWRQRQEPKPEKTESLVPTLRVGTKSPRCSVSSGSTQSVEKAGFPRRAWESGHEPRPEKTCYVALEDAYHGDTLGGVSVGGVDRYTAMFRPLLFDAIRLPMPDCYRAPQGLSTPNDICQYHLDKLEQVLVENHQRIAAMVIEPLVQAAAGMVVHPRGYLRGVRELTQKYDVLLIADEVAVGFGRTGKMFACEHEEVVPDLLCIGKGLTGGYLPMSATLANDEIWSAFLGKYAESKTFYHGHTYGGNPLCAAAALASLNVFETERTLGALPEKIARLEKHLARIARLPHVGDIRQRGLMAGVELVRDVATKEPYRWEERRGHAVCDSARQKGVWLRPLGNVIVIMPPLAISLEQIDRIAEAVDRGIGEL